MTVITTLISRHCTVHATDSFLTSDGALKPIEVTKSKIIPVRKFRGAMAYWGLAKLGELWSTFDWLQKQIEQAHDFSDPEDFARFVAENLNQELSRLPFVQPIHAGIGIHFTAYERIDDYWIPELFLLSNFSDPTYGGLHDAGVLLTRQTFNVAFNCVPEPCHREREFRLRVHEYLRNGFMLIYNNGDPLMFNRTANLVFEEIRAIRNRGELASPDDVATYRKITLTLIKIVSDLQKQFVVSAKRRIGGKPHNLSITSTGEYGSDTGDAP